MACCVRGTVIAGIGGCKLSTTNRDAFRDFLESLTLRWVCRHGSNAADVIGGDAVLFENGHGFRSWLDATWGAFEESLCTIDPFVEPKKGFALLNLFCGVQRLPLILLIGLTSPLPD